MYYFDLCKTNLVNDPALKTTAINHDFKYIAADKFEQIIKTVQRDRKRQKSRCVWKSLRHDTISKVPHTTCAMNESTEDSDFFGQSNQIIKTPTQTMKILAHPIHIGDKYERNHHNVLEKSSTYKHLKFLTEREIQLLVNKVIKQTIKELDSNQLNGIKLPCMKKNKISSQNTKKSSEGCGSITTLFNKDDTECEHSDATEEEDNEKNNFVLDADVSLDTDTVYQEFLDNVLKRKHKSETSLICQCKHKQKEEAEANKKNEEVRNMESKNEIEKNSDIKQMVLSPKESNLQETRKSQDSVKILYKNHLKCETESTECEWEQTEDSLESFESSPVSTIPTPEAPLPSSGSRNSKGSLSSKSSKKQNNNCDSDRKQSATGSQKSEKKSAKSRSSKGLSHPMEMGDEYHSNSSSARNSERMKSKNDVKSDIFDKEQEIITARSKTFNLEDEETTSDITKHTTLSHMEKEELQKFEAIEEMIANNEFEKLEQLSEVSNNLEYSFRTNNETSPHKQSNVTNQSSNRSRKSSESPQKLDTYAEPFENTRNIVKSPLNSIRFEEISSNLKSFNESTQNSKISPKNALSPNKIEISLILPNKSSSGTSRSLGSNKSALKNDEIPKKLNNKSVELIEPFEFSNYSEYFENVKDSSRISKKIYRKTPRVSKTPEKSARNTFELLENIAIGQNNTTRSNKVTSVKTKTNLMKHLAMIRLEDQEKQQNNGQTPHTRRTNNMTPLPSVRTPQVRLDSNRIAALSKITSLQEHIINMFGQIEERLTKIDLPEDILEQKRREKRVAEFSIRFTRQYLYQIERMMEEIRLTPKEIFFSNSNDCQVKVCSLYATSLQALQAYFKQIKCFLINMSPKTLEMLILCIKQSTKLCIHKKLFARNDTVVKSLLKGCNKLLKFIQSLVHDIEDKNKVEKLIGKWSNSQVNKLFMYDSNGGTLKKSVQSKYSGRMSRLTQTKLNSKINIVQRPSQEKCVQLRKTCSKMSKTKLKTIHPSSSSVKFQNYNDDKISTVVESLPLRGSQTNLSSSACSTAISQQNAQNTSDGKHSDNHFRMQIAKVLQSLSNDKAHEIFAPLLGDIKEFDDNNVEIHNNDGQSSSKVTMINSLTTTLKQQQRIEQQDYNYGNTECKSIASQITSKSSKSKQQLLNQKASEYIESPNGYPQTTTIITNTSITNDINNDYNMNQQLEELSSMKLRLASLLGEQRNNTNENVDITKSNTTLLLDLIDASSSFKKYFENILKSILTKLQIQENEFNNKTYETTESKTQGKDSKSEQVGGNGSASPVKQNDIISDKRITYEIQSCEKSCNSKSSKSLTLNPRTNVIPATSDCQNKDIKELIESVKNDRLNYIKEITNNPMYVNDNFPEPWKVLKRISERVFNQIAEGAVKEYDLSFDEEKFVNDFLNKEFML